MRNVHTCVTDNTTYTLVYVRPVCQILMMNVHTCVTNNTTYTMFYVRSVYLI